MPLYISVYPVVFVSQRWLLFLSMGCVNESAFMNKYYYFIPQAAVLHTQHSVIQPHVRL